ncbi:hypothetical protein FPV67DRAFT_1673148 [Lyophyllum atratum]|nr:hypothetical protein FPV67DRAFT_1673148 [Lyophyllum atratum]
MFYIPYFSRRAADKQAMREAEIRFMQDSPVIKLGSFTVVNPTYKGPNPYRGPEVTDPKNAGKAFIFIRGDNITAPQSELRRAQAVQIAERREPSISRRVSTLGVKLLSLRYRRHKPADESRPESSYTEERNLSSSASPARCSTWFDEEGDHSTRSFTPCTPPRSAWFDEEEDYRTKGRTWLKRLLSGRRTSSKRDEELYMLGLDASDSMQWVSAERSPRFSVGTQRRSSQAEVIDPFMKPPRRIGHYAESFYSRDAAESRLSLSGSSW